MHAKEHHTIEELGRALQRLRTPTIVRLTALARSWVRLSGQRGADDLLNEAISRALSGGRRWPIGLPLDAFLSGVMKSIASQWAQEDRAAMHVELDEAAGVVTDGGRTRTEFDDMLARMTAVLALDPEARGILHGLTEGSTREEMQVALGMNTTGYDTARRRMVRVLAKAFGPDWKDKV